MLDKSLMRQFTSIYRHFQQKRSGKKTILSAAFQS